MGSHEPSFSIVQAHGTFPQAFVQELDKVFQDFKTHADRWLQVEVRVDGGVQVVWLRVARRADGQVICTGLLLGADGEAEVTSRVLRRLPMSKLLRYVADSTVPTVAGSLVAMMALGSDERLPLNPTRAGSLGLPAEHFQKVAQGYREALREAPRSPVKYLAERWRHPTPTIRRWIRQARERGLLGETTQGRAGEKPPKERRTT